jgi:DNA repair photolyase
MSSRLSPSKGRGALSQPPSRFARETREPLADGWWTEEADTPAPLPTVMSEERSSTIISRNTSPDVPFDRSVNPYRGCEHGCIYCFARPTHAYLGLSPGLDFETRLFAKVNAATLLEAELARPSYQVRTLMLGANTDPYQPIERSLRITRRVLEVLYRCRHPVAIATKGALILRDLDLLAALAAERLVHVGISLATLDPALARVMEPRAPSPARRLAAIAGLSAAGVPVSVLVAPVIPALTDHEIESLLAAAAAHGATGASYVLLRLPGEIAPLFAEWLAAHRPERAQRVLNRLKAHRDGAIYSSAWGERMKGRGGEAAFLARRFALACRRAGLAPRAPGGAPLDASRFRPPARLSAAAQLRLF